jgi:hypothetical protein
MIARFKVKGCDPTNQPLEHPFKRVADPRRCLPTDEIQSMAFWCDGFDGIDMTKPLTKTKKEGKSKLGLILGLSLGLGGSLLLVIGLLVAYHTNWTFRTWFLVSCDRMNPDGTTRASHCRRTILWWEWIYRLVSGVHLLAVIKKSVVRSKESSPETKSQ